MKKYLSVLLCLCLLLTAAGCGQNSPADSSSSTHAATTVPLVTTEPTQPETTAPIVYSSPLTAVSLPLVREVETAPDGTVLFTYTYQNVYAILQDPDVADTVILDLMNRIDSTRSAADSIRATVEADYALSDSWTPYFYQVIYNPMRIDQGVFSLYGTQISYNGNPHPSHLSVSANYDLVTGKALHFGDILSEDYSAEQLCQLIAEALEPRAQELYAYYTEILADRFSSDFSYLETWYFSETGLCFYFSPYDIAPYSAGTITAEIPYEKLNGILRDDFFPAERSAGSGTVSAVRFQDADLGQITQFAELIINSDGQQALLLPEGILCNVRIEQGSWTSGGFTPEATVFAAESLSTGDAIMLQALLSETEPTLRLTYRSGDDTVHVFISQSADGTVTLAEK